MLRIAAALLPIIALVGLGAALLRFGFYDAEFRRRLDRLVYWVCLPALLIGKLSTHPLGADTLGTPLLTYLLATGGTIVVGYLGAWLLALGAPQRGVLVQGGFRGNLAFVGLPVLLLASQSASRGEAIAAQGLLLLAPLVLIYNLVAVTILELERSQLRWAVLPRLAKSVALNPLVLACAVGLLLGNVAIPLPPPVLRALELLGAPAAPLALLSLGGTLIVYPIGSQRRATAAGVLLKLVVAPTLAWAIGSALMLGPQAQFIVMVFASTPTAVASYVMAAQLGGDESLAASIVVLTTLLSCASLGVALTFAV